MKNISDLFPSTYDASRERFRQYLNVVQKRWPRAVLSQQRLKNNKDLTIDWIQSNALEKNEKVLIITTAEHGIEGYVGSAMLDLFIKQYLNQLDPANTGLFLVHTINPWGMKHRRRTNTNNVDLNRNFVYQTTDLDPDYNPASKEIDAILHPRQPLGNYFWSHIPFLLQVLRYSLKMGLKNFRSISLLGQYHNPQGIHYGGKYIQEETLAVMEFYREAFKGYQQILLLDMHTGHGPRYQMSLVNSVFETGKSQEFEKRFNFPLVVAANPEEFYDLRGDMIDYIYTLQQKEFPHKRLYAVSFEFGTYGDSNLAALRSMRTMLFENRAYCQGATKSKNRAKAARALGEMFAPKEGAWRVKAVEDGNRAFQGILKAEGFIQ
ncbi:MAG: M14 family metallopeptidase [Anaerolineales bacterium]|nr:M14 family metallopeptidase [Anaerolineales bacterium]